MFLIPLGSHPLLKTTISKNDSWEQVSHQHMKIQIGPLLRIICAVRDTQQNPFTTDE
jgi:hypothetical protein